MIIKGIGGISLCSFISSRRQLIAAAVLACFFGMCRGLSGNVADGLTASCAVFFICLPLPGVLSAWVTRKCLQRRAAALGASLHRPAGIFLLAKADVLLLSWRGVLTQGAPHITELVPEGMSQSGLLALAAAAARESVHPIGRVIYATAVERGLRLPRTSAQTQQPQGGVEALCAGDTVRVGSPDWLRTEGVQFSAELLTTVDQLHCRGASVVALSVGSRARGLIALSYDTPAGTAAIFAELARAGLPAVLMTQAAPKLAHALAKSIGLRSAHGGLSPEKQNREAQFLRGKGQILALLDAASQPAPGLAPVADVHLILRTTKEPPGAVDIVIPALSALPELLSLGRRAARACTRCRKIALFGALALILFLAGCFPLWGHPFAQLLSAIGCLLLLSLLALIPLRGI